jgi:hypothetical protein
MGPYNLSKNGSESWMTLGGVDGEERSGRRGVARSGVGGEEWGERGGRRSGRV